MPRSAESWVRTQFAGKIRKLSPTDPEGDTIVWGQEDKLGSDGEVIGTAIHHTYVADFVKAAKDIIEDETADAGAVHAELKARELVPG